MTKSILLAFLLSSVSLVYASEQAITPAPSEEQSTDTKGKKRILDLVRKGVVVIDVKTYANVDANERVSWAGSGFHC